MWLRLSQILTDHWEAYHIFESLKEKYETPLKPVKWLYSDTKKCWGTQHNLMLDHDDCTPKAHDIISSHSRARTMTKCLRIWEMLLTMKATILNA